MSDDTTSSKRRGRPPKTEAERAKSQRLTVVLAREVYDWTKEESERQGFSHGGFINHLCRLHYDARNYSGAKGAGRRPKYVAAKRQ